MAKNVWVFGASSGLGLHTAQALRDAGFTVIAGARSFADAAKREDENCLPLDVTSEESVQAFTAAAAAITGVPDAIVYCAGVLNLGACETYEDCELRQVMDTNFFGLCRAVRHALPLMRARKRGSIVVFSSINGLLGIPFEGAYTASKHAIEGYLECLRMEVMPFGIRVMVVEPGDHQSGSSAYRSRGRGMTPDSPYFSAYEKGISVIRHDEQNGSDPDKLGRKVARALKKRRLPCKMCIAKWDQRLAVLLHDVLPAGLFARFIRSYYGKSLNSTDKGDHNK